MFYRIIFTVNERHYDNYIELLWPHICLYNSTELYNYFCKVYSDYGYNFTIYYIM